MALTPSKIQALVEAELLSLQDLRVTSHIRSLLVEPSIIFRDWDYGDPGQTFPCWLVLSHMPSNTGIAYCEFGFGPRIPWGLVFLSGGSIGMDSAWFGSFLASYFESMAASDLPIWRVFKRHGPFDPGIAITAEADWDSTWNEISQLRASDPNSEYNCWHNIRYEPSNPGTT